MPVETFNETVERCQLIWNGIDNKYALFESFGMASDNDNVAQFIQNVGIALRRGIHKYTADLVPSGDMSEVMRASDTITNMAVTDMMLVGMLIGRERERVQATADRAMEADERQAKLDDDAG